MRIDLAAATGTAWTLFKRDRDVLLALAGMFLFLPSLAMLLLIASPPAPVGGDAGQAAIEQWANQYVAWMFGNLPWLTLAALVTLFGSLAITAFYVDRAKPDVGGAIGVAARLLPGFALVMMGVTAVASVGLLLFVLPGLWVLGRVLLATPVLVAEQGSAIDAVRRSVTLTRGHGLVMAGLAGIGTFGGQLLASPFLAVDEALRAADAANPVAVMLVDIAAAAIAAAVALAMILLRIAIYWRAGAPSSGT